MPKIRGWARKQAHSPEHSASPAADGQPARPADDQVSAAAATDNTATDDAPGAVSKGEGAPYPAHQQTEPQSASALSRFWIALKKSLFNSWINVLLVFVPVGIASHFAGLRSEAVFGLNAVAIVPLAGLLSYATESVAHSLGDTLGALMNVSFGNAVELIIFIIALVKNEIRIVQASLLGSLLANLLLILGMCFLVGGLEYREQIYNSTVTQMSACLLCLAVLSLLLPTAFHASFSSTDRADAAVVKVSRGSAVILLLVYGLYLLFQLKSHAYMYQSTPQHIIDEESHPGILQRMNTHSSTSSSSSSSSASSTSSRSTNRIRRIGRKLGRKRRSAFVSAVEGESSASAAEPEEKDAADMEGAADVQPDTSEDGVVCEDIRSASEDLPSTTRPIRPLSMASNGEVLSTIPQRQQMGPVSTRPNAVSRLTSMRPRAPPVFRSPFPADSQIPGESRRGSYSDSRQGSVPLRRTRSLPTVPARSITYVRNTGSARIAGHAPYGLAKPVNGDSGREEVEGEAPLSTTGAVVLLLASTALVALCAEFLVDSINDMVKNTPLSEAFIGLIILPIVGNAAEHVTSVTMAKRNKMDLALGVSLGSSIQIAIFVTPLVVIIGWIMDKPMSLYFNLFETVSLLATVFIVNFLVLDGRSNYLEGALLCAAYVIIALGSYFFPDADNQSSLTVGQEKRWLEMGAGMMGMTGM